MSLFLGAALLGPHGGCTLAVIQSRFPGAHVVSCLAGGGFDSAPTIITDPTQYLLPDASYAVVTSGECE